MTTRDEKMAQAASEAVIKLIIGDIIPVDAVKAVILAAWEREKLSSEERFYKCRNSK